MPPTKPPYSPLLTVTIVAEILRTSEKTVRRRIKNGELPFVRHGRAIRILPEDLEAYIAARRVFGNGVH